MALSVSLSTLRTRVRRMADVEGDTTRFPDAELTAYINESLTWVYDLLVEADENFYASTTPATVSVVNGVSTYALSSSVYKVLGMDVSIGGEVLTLRPFEWTERNRYTSISGWSVQNPLAYQLRGNNVSFIPTPTSSHTVSVYYVPAFALLSADGDTFDGVNGWEELAVIQAAIKVLRKDDRPTNELERDRDVLLSRIEAMKPSRDLGSPHRVVDVANSYDSSFDELP